MKSYIYAFIISVSLGATIVGCSNVGFESNPRLACTTTQDTQCKVNGDSNTYTLTFRSGDVDILFVDDNSGSMYVQQQKMAAAFPTFISKISNLFYQIAFITTDVSATAGNSVPKAANGNGAFQDGKFLELVDTNKVHSGEYILTRDMSNAASLFAGTIQRDETNSCEQNGYQAAYCPSDDERGIYALNDAVTRGDSDFFRDGAHLAIVIIANEDERSNGGNIPGYPLETNDLPDTLIKNLKTKFPTKSVSVHTVIVQPGDSNCLRSQTVFPTNGGWPTYGQYGTTYAQLSNPSSALLSYGNLQAGVSGSICAVNSNYESQIGDIGSEIGTDAMNSPKQLACATPTSLQLVTTPTGYENQVQYQLDSSGVIRFTNVPIGVEVSFSYDCARF